MAVLIDLRNGSLSSLDAYLKKHRGIPDREVALELSNLLSGSAAQTRFRLMVVDHPDGPPSKGGRPKSATKTPKRSELELCSEYLAQLSVIGKTKAAREQAAKARRRSTATIRRAIKKVEAAEQEEREFQMDRHRWECALERVKEVSGTDT